MNNNKLYIGNLAYGVTSDSLRDLFSKFGELVDATVVQDKFSGRSRGFGFVEFKTEDDAKKALDAMNEQEVEGRKIFVSVARPKKQTMNNG